MNFVYDILVNFKYPIIDFYEWNKKDNIENIKKIPLCKIDTTDLKQMKMHKFKLEDISIIKKGTKLFNNKKKLYNAVIFTDTKEALAFNFDDNGLCIGKSFLLFDEESEILDSSNLLEKVSIKYKIISSDKLDFFRTRKEVYITKYLLNELDKIKDMDKFNYICYECFDELNNLTKKRLLDMIKEKWDDRYYKIYDFLTLISMNKH